jgi:23S rRNA (guanosine2251-2'-O)-methyltransferase
MTTKTYEIRVCDSCGLRYPLMEGHPFGTRCPICMGDTHLILSRELVTEPESPRPSGRGWLSVLIDNIRSAWNVGSIFRSADGFGFAHAYLCGITPTPENDSVRKTSLGAEDSVPWSYHKDALKLAKGLKKEGWRILALEEDRRAKQLNHFSASTQRSVLIIGNEVSGVDPGLLALCDEILYIPMYGDKKSFNVATAFGIAAYELNDKEKNPAG